VQETATQPGVLSSANQQDVLRQDSMVASCFVSLKLEALLIMIAGVMALTTAVTSYRNTHAQTYRLLVIGPADGDVITWCCASLALIGLFNLIVGVVKSMRRSGLTFNQYVTIVVVTLVGNFCVGMVLTGHKSKVMDGLEPAMMAELKESVAMKNKFGVGFAVSEAWDRMQIKTLCCGVNGYKDYIELGHANANNNMQVPVSCCAMKRISDDLPVPDNLNQCQLDAKLGAVSSIFLNTQGCHGPLSRWLIRVINKMTAMVFGTICLQALGVFYLSWVGYRRSVAYQSAH